jgi:hypothetical protein
MSVSSLSLLLALRGCVELRILLLISGVDALVVIMFFVLEVIVVFIRAVVDFILRDMVVIGHATALAVGHKREMSLEHLLIRLGTVVVDKLLLAFGTSRLGLHAASLCVLGGSLGLQGCFGLFSQALGSREGCSRASTTEGRCGDLLMVALARVGKGL